MELLLPKVGIPDLTVNEMMEVANLHLGVVLENIESADGLPIYVVTRSKGVLQVEQEGIVKYRPSGRRSGEPGD